MNKSKLTVKQKIVLDFIESYQSQYKVRPTHLEIAQKLGTTIGASFSKVNSLLRKKLIVLENNIYIINQPE